MTVLLAKELPVSSVYRLGIKYSHPAGTRSEPQTLFLKLSRADAPKKLARAEVEFYQRAAPAISCPPLVRCYSSEYEEHTGRSHILLEDLSATHSQPAEHHPPSESASRMAVEALANVHAAWWNDPRLGDQVGRVFDDEWLAKFVADLEVSVTRFLDLVRGELSPRELEAYGLMLRVAPYIWGRLTRRDGLTLTHGDAHWWNFLYPSDTAKGAVHIIDWQLWHIDLGARDLAFLIAAGGFAEPRPELEAGLLRQYHEALIANGVYGYSWGDLMRDYRWSAIRNLNLPIIFHSQGKHESTWRAALRHSLDAFERLKCAELIS